MAKTGNTMRKCPQGHRYYKSSDCPTCPVCEVNRKPEKGFLALLAAPARRALEKKGIFSLHHLAAHSEKEILQLHGVGENAMLLLRKAMDEKGLTFKVS